MATGREQAGAAAPGGHGHGHGGHGHGGHGHGPLISRRGALRAGLAAAALVLTPAGALAAPLLPGAGAEAGAGRESRLGRRSRLVHADLHNHSQLSDGAGDPARAHDSMRAAGLDVAALTDHSVMARPAGPRDLCSVAGAPVAGQADPCRSITGMSAAAWEATGRWADAADDPGRFTALRGFEWSSPFLGHVNVWFTDGWVDPLSTAALTAAHFAEFGLGEAELRQLLGPLPDGEAVVDMVLGSEPAGMARFYDWLQRSPNAVLGGGGDGLAGFNHPNREPHVFDAFAFDPRVRERMVSMEIMNRQDDFLFMAHEYGAPSPLVACLDAGWRVGLLGVTDEHGTAWGQPAGLGRAGLYVSQFSRSGVRRALADRDFFATGVAGLRLDATAQGTRMGQVVRDRRRRVTFEVDVDRGPDHAGEPLEVQVLTSGELLPTVLHVESVRTPSPGDRRPIRFDVEVDRATTSWAVLRIADPTAPNTHPGPAGHPCNDRALAYASPFFLDGGRPARSHGPRRGTPPVLGRVTRTALDLLRHGH